MPNNSLLVLFVTVVHGMNTTIHPSVLKNLVQMILIKYHYFNPSVLDIWYQSQQLTDGPRVTRRCKTIDTWLQGVSLYASFDVQNGYQGKGCPKPHFMSHLDDIQYEFLIKKSLLLQFVHASSLQIFVSV